MFNPLSIVLKNDAYENYLEEAMSIRDIYNSNIESLSDAITDSHEKFIHFQEKIFEKIRGKEPRLEVTTSEILSHKLEKFSHGVFDVLRNKITDNSKALLKYIKNTKDQVELLKRIFSKPQNKTLANTLYVSKGIGFKTTELPTQEEYAEAISPYEDAWKRLDPLEEDELYNRFDKCYRSKELLMNEMFTNVKFYFEPDTPYKASEYVNTFDEMNKDMISMLSKHKEKYERVRKFLSYVNIKCTEEYNKDIENLKKSFDPDKEKKIEIATHNYKVLSDTLIYMIDLVSIYHRIQLKILLISYENYKHVIQLIYDDCMDGDK